ncbi:MAG: hypothetical protein COA69_01495 [Robiginitomaculum sp.]|nr:MAG: hypothetical protein COA69_01495 [Robiginitomaculum sp.]
MSTSSSHTTYPATYPAKLPLTLLIMRISIALFLLPWVIEKFTNPETTAKIFAHFYHIENLSVYASYGVGGLWALLWLAFVSGYKKRFSYGLVMGLHGLGTIFTWRQLMPFLETHNHLFLAALPTLGAMIALYLLRSSDTMFSLK